MTFKGMQEKFGFDFGLFRRSTSHATSDSAAKIAIRLETPSAGKRATTPAIIAAPMAMPRKM